MVKDNKPVNILMILDGWGINTEKKGNAFAQADTPFLDSLVKDYPSCQLSCSGSAVGLPDGTMGNSEVGHMNIGAGRKVPQDFVRINMAIEEGSFYNTQALSDAMETVTGTGKSLHLMGLLSDGGVHSHINHLFALIKMAQKKGVKNCYIHPILDGRDTSPTSGIQYVNQLEDFLIALDYGQIATLVGRYWAMDRDTRWDRVERAYNLFTLADGNILSSSSQAVEDAYAKGQTDEFLEPAFISADPEGTQGEIDDGDALIFFNFRADRAKEITKAFTEKEFNGFVRKKTVELSHFVCMTQYDETFDLPVAFGPQYLSNILGEIISQNGLTQLRIAETEKYAHVTYFLNGGDEKVFEGEKRILIPSPRDVATYDEKPQMSAIKVTETVCEKINNRSFNFIVLNYANMDMVGHTGIMGAAIKACETVDQCVKQVLETIWKTGGTAIVTADHGNSEQMFADDGSPHTAHTLNPVQLILAGENYKGAVLKDGILGDIAPTILKILNIDQPEEMTGTSLI